VSTSPGSSPAGSDGDVTDPPRESTDPRIINRGRVNQKVLDALKQVKRRDAPVSDAPPRVDEAPAETVADRLAAGSLQVAIRMEQNGRLEEAIRFLENSISKSPDAPSLYNRLAIILMRERGDLRRAEQMLQKAIELAPGNEVYEKNLKVVVSKRAMAKK
jgi:tetratricopeptide (TPR) repeat protein